MGNTTSNPTTKKTNIQRVPLLLQPDHAPLDEETQNIVDIYKRLQKANRRAYISQTASAVTYGVAALICFTAIAESQDRSGFTSFSVPTAAMVSMAFSIFRSHHYKCLTNQVTESIRAEVDQHDNSINDSNQPSIEATKTTAVTLANNLLHDQQSRYSFLAQSVLLLCTGVAVCVAYYHSDIFSQLYGGLTVLAGCLAIDMIIETKRQKACGGKNVFLWSCGKTSFDETLLSDAPTIHLTA